MPGDNGKLQTVFKCWLRFGLSAYIPYKTLNIVEGKAVKAFNAMVKAGAELPADSSSEECADQEEDFALAADTAKDIIRGNSLSPIRSLVANTAGTYAHGPPAGSQRDGPWLTGSPCFRHYERPYYSKW